MLLTHMGSSWRRFVGDVEEVEEDEIHGGSGQWATGGRRQRRCGRVYVAKWGAEERFTGGERIGGEGGVSWREMQTRSSATMRRHGVRKRERQCQRLCQSKY